MKKPNRSHIETSKIRAMGSRQIALLKRWFLKEELTYAEARRRYLEKFGVGISTNTLHKFWHRHCAPKPPAGSTATPESGVLLDVVIQTRPPVRLTILQRQHGLRIESRGVRPRNLPKAKTSRGGGR